ncbi:MAG TPA: hypothetical protein VKJ01_12545 [Candidatus Solibacter sp.]|nr:hypothetical protein [Candidatus Solibacter sp.]
MIEVPVEQARRVATEGRRLSHSAPLELIALLFAREPRSPEEKSLREALALSIDRASIRSVFLQGEGEPAASLLPNWMSGYGFLFPAEANLTRANEERARVHPIPAWTIGYDAGDALSRLLAERIALNARDAGLSLQPIAGTSADIGVVRIPLASTDAWSALAGIAASTGLPAAKLNGDSLEELYLTELATLATQRLIPLFHLPATYAASPALRNWSPGRDGSWRLAEVWLGSAKP